MSVKKYLLIVITVTVIFSMFSVFVWYKHGTVGSGANMPDGTIDTDVEGLAPVEKSKPYNILVLGVDVEAKLTDVMILCQVDPVDKEVRMLSIPRDTRVKMSRGYGKINSTYSRGGVENVISYVKDLTGLPVHHYFLINTKAFRDTIDALGGVRFNVPQRMDYEDPLQNLYIHLAPGEQLLDGSKAEQFVRFRQYPNGDVDRIKAQQAFVQELIEQKLTAANIVKIPKVFSIIEKNSNTDMSPEEMVNTGKQLLAVRQKGKTFDSYTIPGEGGYVGEVSFYLHYEDELKTLVAEKFK